MNNKKLTRDQIVTDLESLLSQAEEDYDGDPVTPADGVELGKMIAYRRAIDLLLQGDSS